MMDDNERIITVQRTAKHFFRTRKIWQYDVGHVLRFDGFNLPFTFQVHFANSKTGEAKPQVGQDNVCEVPPEYTQNSGVTYAWLYEVTEDTGLTKHEIEIPVDRRAKPTDQEPTPAEQSVIDQTIAASNYALEKAQEAQQAAEDAAESVKNASATAETLSPGSPATVVVEDVEGAKTFHFGIPEGRKGETGERGPQGERGVQGVQGEKGEQGEQGEKGDTGDSGVYIGDEAPQDEQARVWIKPNGSTSRVESLDSTALLNGTIIDAVGIPVYVDDPTDYSAYGLTESGWYLFAKIQTPDESAVTANTQVVGAHAIIPVGQDYVQVAVRFPVAATSQSVVVNWGGQTETFVFRATDLAQRNLDSRITFYIYDIAPFATWSYTLTTDATFVADKKYYTESDGVYTLADVTVGDAVPADTYYNHSKLHFEGMTRNVTYRLDEIVDCPIEIALPEVASDGYGAWFEIQMRYNGSYSCTLLPPTGVKIGTATTQAQTAGVNIIDLQYTDVDEVQMWTLLNTHSNIPA